MTVIFVQDAGWEAAAKRYESFLNTNADSQVLFLELGVGGNTPVIIKYPFWKMTARNPQLNLMELEQATHPVLAGP